MSMRPRNDKLEYGRVRLEIKELVNSCGQPDQPTSISLQRLAKLYSDVQAYTGGPFRERVLEALRVLYILQSREERKQ